MGYVTALADQIRNGKQITPEEAEELYSHSLEELCQCADEIRRRFCGNGFDLCTIVNAKSGRCTENCKFCAQSAHHQTCVEAYPLLSEEELVLRAKANHEAGVLRYSLVTSGKRLTDGEVDQMCAVIRRIRREVGISVCLSFGLLEDAQYRRLKDAGATRVHNNLETSRRNFPHICTTHSFDDKINAIKAAQAAGLSVCSGGIMGLGETVADRISLAFSLRTLGVKSVPINILNPIPGTPLEANPRLTTDDIRRIVAVYRFVLPDAAIRLAGGRGLLGDQGASCFRAGANAAITGDMLTTEGITVKTDQQLLQELGYEVKRDHE